jgi:hypothetical protein
MRKGFGSLCAFLGLGLAVLIAVALSVPSDNAHPTYLQQNFTFILVAVIGGCVILALVIALIVALVTGHENLAYAVRNQMHEREISAKREREILGLVSQGVAIAGWSRTGYPLIAQFDNQGRQISKMLPAATAGIVEGEWEYLPDYSE